MPILIHHKYHLLLSFILSYLMLILVAQADNRVNIVKGVVGAVSVVTNEQGQPILGKYSAEGDYLDDIDSEYSQTGYSVLSAQSYKIAYQLAQDLKTANPGSTLISRSAYDGRGYTTQGKNPISMIKPRLKNDSGTLSLLIVNEQQLYNSEPAYEQFILQEFSIDLSDGNAQQLDDTSVSIIVNKAGQLQYQSPYTLGYKIAPFKTNADGTYQTEKDYRIATHPLGRVTLVAGNYYGGSASNPETGRYVLPYAIPPCPGFFYQLKVPIVAKVPIHNFNPKKSNSATTIPAIAYDYASCIGYGDAPIGATLQALNAQITAKGIVAQITKPTSNLNFTFATMQLAAIARFKDVTLSDITEYHNENLTIKYSQDINFDFDGDDQDDLIVEHKNADGSIDETKIDIYLGDREEYTNGIRNKPDLTRLADYEQIKQHKNQALLKTISEDDLNNTDIYYYRSSTGQLIGSTEGLGKKDNNNQNAIITGGANSNSYVYQQIEKDQATATFSFANLLIGAESNDLISGYVTDPNKTRRLPWIGSNAAASEVKAEDPVNYLRPGESVDIIAINRATGYIGNIQVKLPLGNNEIIQHKITMMPPNLKVIATRSYKTQAGLKKDTQNDNQLIGSEGAGLSSDQYIKIQTIWLDQQGKVLPAKLSGYTGRVAVVRSGQTDGSDTFDISPGYNTEFIKLNNADDLQNEHYYVQVSGESKKDGNPNFDTGSATGKLATRPRTYVPLKVPVFDEAQTVEAQNLHLQATLAKQTDLAKSIDPIYRWVYRPEMQFSVFDLTVNKIELSDNENTNPPINILNLNSPVVGGGLNIDVFLTLLSPEEEALEFFGPGQDLILQIGENEYLIKQDETGQQQLTEKDSDHFADLTALDFLTISLFMNNDAGNVLWSFAFDSIYIEPTTIGYNNQDDETYYVTADEPEVELKAGIVGYAYRKEENKDPSITMNWKTDGSGSMVERSQTTNEYGLFDNTLVMSTKKGDTANVSIQLQSKGSDANPPSFEWKTVEVLAGKTTRIDITTTGEAIALEQGDVRIDYTLYDAYNNLVEDGTEIDLDFSNSLLLKDSSLSTENGKAYAVFSGGEYSANDVIVSVSSQGITKDATISIAPLNISLNAAKTTLKKSESTPVTATVTKPDGSPAANVPVLLSAGKGFFAEQQLITNSAGQITTTFTAGINEVSDTWYAQVGYISSAEQSYSVTSGSPNNIDAQDAMLLGDEMQAGTLNFNSYGVDVSINYETQATLSVRGAIGDSVTIGDMADPNLEPLLILSMNTIITDDNGSQFNDEHSLNPGRLQTANNQPLGDNNNDAISIVKDHPLGAGKSAQLQQNSRINIAQNPIFNIKDNAGFRLDLKPQSDGTIVSYDKDALKLSYSNNTLTLKAVTTDGSYQVIANNINPNQWHRIAVNISGNQLNLYVNGTQQSTAITGTPIQGNPLLNTTDSIQIGGLTAVMRSFRVYDYASQALISYNDDSTITTLTNTQQTLNIKSLGKLGQAITGSQLKTMRIAVIVNDQRNYASILSKQGYQDIAQNYLYTVSPQVPIASLANPLNGLIPTAHAWTWDGVWDGVKSTVGFLIPYEDFITIAQQLSYLAKQDWENFDASTLAFASLSAATIIPLLSPLKPVLGPLKAMLAKMNKFPAARHFAGAVGTGVTAALSGKTEKIANLLPFILIAVELYQDDEVFTFIMNAIDSEDDLWVWVDYVAQTLADEENSQVASNNLTTEQIYALAQNPMPWVVDDAQAIPIAVGAAVIKNSVKRLLKRFPADQAKEVTDVLRKIARTPFVYKLAIKSTSLLSYMAKLGAARVAIFIKNSKKWRVNRWFILFAIAYLEEEQNKEGDGKLDLVDPSQLQKLIARLFSSQIHVVHGAVFQLSQVAYYHALSQLTDGNKVIAIEQNKPAFEVINGKKVDNEYKRRVDIVLQDGNGSDEEWVEVKSLDNARYVPSNFKYNEKKKLNSFSYYREFFHDMRMNDEFITTNNNYKKEVLGNNTFKTNKQYTWRMHKFTKGAGKSPTKDSRLKLPREELCKAGPSGNYYKYNLKGNKPSTKSACEGTIDARVTLTSTSTYINEIVRRLISEQDLDIADFVDAVESISDPEWQ